MKKDIIFNNFTTTSHQRSSLISNTLKSSLNSSLAFVVFQFTAIIIFLCLIITPVSANQPNLPTCRSSVILKERRNHFIEGFAIMSYRLELITKIEQYQLDQRDPYWETIRLVAERGMLSEQISKGLLYEIESPIQHQKDFPNYTHRIPTPDQFYVDGTPDVRLGALLENPDLAFGLRFDLPLHIVVAGTTGFGKTTLNRVLQKGVFEYNQHNPNKPKSVIIFDRKVNDYTDQAKRFGWLIFGVPGTLILSLEAPQGVPPNVWINILATLFCARANLKAGWVTIANALRWLLAALNPNPTDHLIWPDLNLLLDVLNASPDTLFSSKAEYTQALKQPLEGIKHSSGNVFQGFQGFQVERDVIAAGKSAVISMPNMFPSWTRQFFTDVILAQILYSRIHRSHRVDATEVLIIIEEADSDISTEAEEMFPDHMCPVSQCFKQGREFGISVCVSISSLRSASRFVLSNATHHFLFRMNDAESIIEASRTLMLPPLGQLSLNSLQPGECLVKQIGPWPHAMIGKVDYIPPCRTQPDSYDIHPFTEAKSLEELTDVQNSLQKAIAEHRNTKLHQIRKKTSGLSKHARPLQDLISLHPWTPTSRLWKKIGKVPFTVQIAVRNELESRGLARFLEERIGRSNQLLPLLTKKGYEYLGKEPPKEKGRGGDIHTFCCQWIQMWGKNQGYQTFLEKLVPGTNHPADCILKIYNQLHVYEVISKCEKNIISHLQSCFIDSKLVATVTIVAPQKKILNRIKKSIEQQPTLAPFLERIKFKPVEFFMKELWP